MFKTQDVYIRSVIEEKEANVIYRNQIFLYDDVVYII